MGKVPRFSAICIFLGVCLAEGYAVAVVRLAVLCVICPGYFFGQSDLYLDLEGDPWGPLRQGRHSNIDLTGRTCDKVTRDDAQRRNKKPDSQRTSTDVRRPSVAFDLPVDDKCK